MFREGQGGQCSWNGVSEGREGGDVFQRYGGKIVQDILDHQKDLDFTLGEMGSPKEGFEQRRKASGSLWLLS